MISWGDVPTSSVLPFMFGTYGKTNGESITLTGLAVTDIEVYKGTTVTQRASDAGYVLLDTDGIDIDGVTGIHGFTIDTGDNTDAGFYASGQFYTVVVSAVTIDSQTVNFVAGTFRLRAADQTGDSYAIVNSGTHGNAAIKGYVDDIGAAGAGLTAIPSVGSVTGNVGGNVAGSVASVAGVVPLDAAGTRTALGMSAADLDTQLDVLLAKWTDALADSVATDGTRPTPEQALLMLTRFLFERAVSGTTVTSKKEDGSTTSMTFTINDATTPTSITRSA